MTRLLRGLHDYAGSLLGERYYHGLITHKMRQNRDQDPVLVWQMGKVGSSTVLASLEQVLQDAPVFHVHILSEALLEKSEIYRRSIKRGSRAYLYNICMRRIFRESMAAGQKWKIISLVREPVGRNLSSFFQNLDLYVPNHKRLEREFLLDTLIRTFIRDFDHDRPLEWFDYEIRGLLGMNVFHDEFPMSTGFKIYKGDYFDLLLLRMEDLDRIAQRAFTTFFGISKINLIRKNTGSEKKYSDIYKNIKERIVLPNDYLDHCYLSKYAQHFYSKKELDGYRRQWSGGR